MTTDTDLLFAISLPPSDPRQLIEEIQFDDNDDDDENDDDGAADDGDWI